jgi:hypothetical protein
MSPYEFSAQHSELLQAEFDQLCEEFAAAEDHPGRRHMALEQMRDVMAAMDEVVRVIVEPGRRPAWPN